MNRRLAVSTITALSLVVLAGRSGISAPEPRYVLGAPMLTQETPKEKKPKNCNKAHPCPDAVPVAVADSVSTQEDATVSIVVLANDTGLEDGGLSVAVTGAPSSGTAVTNADGTISYTPSLNFNGTDGFSYSVTDADGDSATSSVGLTVSPMSDPPSAVADSGTTNEDFSVAVQVLNNDSDPDGDAFTLVAVSAPSNGTTTMNADGSIQYAPAPNANQPDSFTYTIEDATGQQSIGAVTIAITAIDDSARARTDGPFSTSAGTPVTINVLSNDSLPDGFGSVALENAPSAGVAVLNADNTFTYTPDASFTGRDVFSYIVRDADGDASLAYVVVDVT